MNRGWLAAAAMRLRVASSMSFAACCLAVIAFWVRSYTHHDTGFVRTLPGYHIQFNAGYGRITVWFEHKPLTPWIRWNSRRFVASDYIAPNDPNRAPAFDLAFWPTFARLYIAHWVLAVATTCLALAPWPPRRITLRGALAAMTVIACAAGLLVWIDRSF